MQYVLKIIYGEINFEEEHKTSVDPVMNIWHNQ